MRSLSSEGGGVLIKALQKLCRTIDALYMGIAVVLLAIIIIASSLQVFTRYALNASLNGTEELARYCFVWMSMLGASICVSKGAHPAVTILGERLKGRSKAVLEIFLYLLIIAGAIVFIVQGMKMVVTTTSQLSPTLKIPMCYIYLCVPVGGTGMIVHALLRLLEFALPPIEEKKG